MKIGLLTAGLGKAANPRILRAIAEHAERLGFGTLWAPEHVVLFDRYTESKYPYSQDGAFAAPSTIEWMDPFVALTWIAARTSKIRLATGICLVPEHNPLVLAKVIASLDYLSGGRFALGVGIGWSAEEFKALGVPFERRAQRTREYIAAMRKLWSDETTSFHGEFVNFDAARSFPKPMQGGKVPIIFGGESTPALKRVAEYGTGWFGFNLTPEETAAKVEQLKGLMRERGRALREVEIIISPYTKKVTPDGLKGYHAAGVSEVTQLLSIPDDEAKLPAALEQMARDWVEPAAKLG
ncbi:MAG TPA: LLM class F420-dependent oxidoreductase [Candidatus Binataceae bacterium]|nr:LLM class F420-dependent oxidoreductase [Candidatus Binataceae bacterium]